MKKRFLASVIAMLTLFTACYLTTTPPAYASEASLDFCEVNKGGNKGFVENKVQGELVVTEEDGRKVLKFTPDPNAEYAGSPIAIEGFGLSKAGADYGTYRYASIEYKYVSKKPLEGSFSITLCNSNKVFSPSGASIVGSAITANEWNVAYFDFAQKIEGRLATDKDTHPINHIHVRPFPKHNVSAFDPDDELYIGKITFSETNLMPGGVTAEINKPVAPSSNDTATLTESPTSTITPQTLGGDTTGASPAVVSEGDIVVDFTTINRGGIGGFVDKNDFGTLESVTVDGRPALKYTPNPSSPKASSVLSIEGSGMASKLPEAPTYEKFNYLSVEYFYATDKPSYESGMCIYLANSNKVFESGGMNVYSGALTTGKWDVAYFDISGAKPKLKIGLDEHILNHIHLRPLNTKVSALRETDVIYIGKIGFHQINPNPKTEYTVSYRKGITGLQGDDLPSSTIKRGEAFTLGECPWTLEGFNFLGWESSADKKTYKPGDTIVADGDYDFTFAALWAEKAHVDNTKGFEYTTLFSEMCDRATTAVPEKVTIDGITAIKCVPNPASEKPGAIILDAFSLANKIKVDLDVYKYITLVYKYDFQSPSNPEIIAPHLQFTRNGGLFKSGVPLKRITDGGVFGKWTVDTYEIPELSANYNDPNGLHMLTQIHVYPYGGKAVSNTITAADTSYIAGMLFHKELPQKISYAPQYITGYEDGTFGVNKTMTRAQACTVVARLIAGSDEAVIAPASSAFSDVKPTDWFFKYVAFCEQKGLLASYSGAFLPNQHITRAEFVELIYNMKLVKDTDGDKTFSDVPQSHPKYNVIMAAANAGLVNGYGDGTFLPNNTITRAQVVTVINNAYGRKSDAELLKGTFASYYKDLEPGHWAFSAIIDASVSHTAVKEQETELDKWLLYAVPVPEVAQSDIDTGVAKLAEIEAQTDKRIAEIRATATSVNVTGKKYYFAESGNDENDGLSPSTPKKSITALNALVLDEGDGVFFKRGDVFRGNINARKGVTYSAYGEGKKPELYASLRNYAGAENWELTSTPNVWKLKIPVLNDVGLTVFNNGEAWGEKRIKGRSDFATGNLADLNKDLTFWHDVSAPTNVEGYLYLRSDKGNPGERFSSIELNVRNNIFRIGSESNVTIDNLCLKYTGAHAVGAGNVTGLTVQNCEFGFIGGSWFRTDTFSRYGNAVEVYGGCDGYVVDNCYIYQVYDAGVTHQYTEGPDTQIIMKDIKYTNNVIADTTYSVEYFIHKPNAGTIHLIQNCLISDNIFTRSGYGFGDQRPDKKAAKHIKGWNSYNEAENFIIKNNIFDRGKYGLVEIGAGVAVWVPTMTSNTYIQNLNATFGNIKSNITIPMDRQTPIYVDENTKDKDAKIYYLPAIEE